MIDQKDNQFVMLIPETLKLVGIISGIWAILILIAATLAYLPGHPNFSLFTTYLSDIGATAGWPQILFNSGTLIATPMRYLVVALLVLRLMQLGAGRAFAIAVLIIGFISSAGTVILTAVPYNISMSIHKLGIPLYFFGVVLLQLLIFIKECKLVGIPKLLPGLSLWMVVVYFTFATLMMLYEQGTVSRNAPVIWEWMAALSSIIWVFAQSFGLGKTVSNRQPC